MYSPCQACFERGKEYSDECNDYCHYAKVVEENELLKEFKRQLDNKPIETLYELAERVCCFTECRDCPVSIYDFEKRTDYEQECAPCMYNLHKWIVEQANRLD